MPDLENLFAVEEVNNNHTTPQCQVKPNTYMDKINTLVSWSLLESSISSARCLKYYEGQFKGFYLKIFI